MRLSSWGGVQSSSAADHVACIHLASGDALVDCPLQVTTSHLALSRGLSVSTSASSSIARDGADTLASL